MTTREHTQHTIDSPSQTRDKRSCHPCSNHTPVKLRGKDVTDIHRALAVVHDGSCGSPSPLPISLPLPPSSFALLFPPPSSLALPHLLPSPLPHPVPPFLPLSTLKALEVVVSLSLMKMEKKAIMSCIHCSPSTNMSTISFPSLLDIALPAHHMSHITRHTSHATHSTHSSYPIYMYNVHVYINQGTPI